MKRILIRIILVFSSFVLVVGVSECLVRKFRPQIPYSQIIELSIDCYSKSPLIPFTLAKNHKCRMTNQIGEFDEFATLNSLGYRGYEFEKEKKDKRKRVLILGDSMTFGWGVSDSSVYPKVLEKLLAEKGENYEVINAGYVGGLSPDSMYVYLKEEGIKLKPDLVILGLFLFNDITDIEANNWVKVDKNGLSEKIESCCHVVDGKILRNKVIELKYRYPLLRESHLFILLVDFLSEKLGVNNKQALAMTKGEKYLGCVFNKKCLDNFSKEEEKMYRLIEAMNNISQNNGSDFLVVFLPVDYQIYKSAEKKYERFGDFWYPLLGEKDYLNKRVKGQLEKKHIKVFDLLDYFEKNKDRGNPFYEFDGHFNTLGNRLTAEAIAEYLLGKE